MAGLAEVQEHVASPATPNLAGPELATLHIPYVAGFCPDVLSQIHARAKQLNFKATECHGPELTAPAVFGQAERGRAATA